GDGHRSCAPPFQLPVYRPQKKTTNPVSTSAKTHPTIPLSVKKKANKTVNATVLRKQGRTKMRPTPSPVTAVQPLAACSTSWPSLSNSGQPKLCCHRT